MTATRCVNPRCRHHAQIPRGRQTRRTGRLPHTGRPTRRRSLHRQPMRVRTIPGGGDVSGYLEHHGFRKGAPEPSRVQGPPCAECGRPMLGGQRKRHGVCSPRLRCCGAHEDLVPDLMKHAADHADAAMKATA
jgi:hypothetical protein